MHEILNNFPFVVKLSKKIIFFNPLNFTISLKLVLWKKPVEIMFNSDYILHCFHCIYRETTKNNILSKEENGCLMHYLSDKALKGTDAFFKFKFIFYFLQNCINHQMICISKVSILLFLFVYQLVYG